MLGGANVFFVLPMLGGVAIFNLFTPSTARMLVSLVELNTCIPMLGGAHFFCASRARWRCEFSFFQPLYGKNAYFRLECSRAMLANTPASVVLRCCVFQHLERHANMECIDGRKLPYMILTHFLASLFFALHSAGRQ